MSSCGSAVPRTATLLLWLIIVAAAAGVDVPCVTREHSSLPRTQDRLQRIGCQHVQWRISYAENCDAIAVVAAAAAAAAAVDRLLAMLNAPISTRDCDLPTPLCCPTLPTTHHPRRFTPTSGTAHRMSSNK